MNEELLQLTRRSLAQNIARTEIADAIADREAEIGMTQTGRIRPDAGAAPPPPRSP
jgi:hypothetical protein